MVHALEKAHRLLKPGGVVVDVRDIDDPARVEVHDGARVSLAGRVVDRSDFDDERQALAALAQVVEDGLFVMEEERLFDHNLHAETLDVLRKYIADEWENTILPEETAQKAVELMSRAADDAEVIVRFSAWMARLRSL